MEISDTKAHLPAHLIIGANDFAKIRTSDRLRVGRREVNTKPNSLSVGDVVIIKSDERNRVAHGGSRGIVHWKRWRC